MKTRLKNKNKEVGSDLSHPQSDLPKVKNNPKKQPIIEFALESLALAQRVTTILDSVKPLKRTSSVVSGPCFEFRPSGVALERPPKQQDNHPAPLWRPSTRWTVA